MITGRIENRHAELPVIFRLPGRGDLTIDFVVDTGFAGYLTLPLLVVSALGLTFLHDTPANLADDSEVILPVYEATIIWVVLSGLRAYWQQAAVLCWVWRCWKVTNW
jgi:predicted aspartyl protease